MSDHREEISRLAEEFEKCRKILLALGDENRQHLILEMMRMGECGGARVGAITERTHLSRPAVSHHLQILQNLAYYLLFKSFLSMAWYKTITMTASATIPRVQRLLTIPWVVTIK